MSHEKRNGAKFFPAAKRTKTTSDTKVEEARQLFLDARAEKAQLGNDNHLSATEANHILDRLKLSFQQSSENDWFHFAARKLYLDIIRKFEFKQQLATTHQFDTQDLCNAYIELKTSRLFNDRGNVEQQNIIKIIDHLSKQLTKRPAQHITSCAPSMKP